MGYYFRKIIYYLHECTMIQQVNGQNYEITWKNLIFFDVSIFFYQSSKVIFI